MIAYNQFLCHLLYILIAFTFTFIFTFLNVFYVPIAYFKHTLTLIRTLTDGDETMDEFSEKLARFQTIIIFIFTGPLILVSSIPADSVVFFYNLFTTPRSFDNETDLNLISEEALEVFQGSCMETLKTYRKDSENFTTTKVPFVEINKMLQAKLGI